MSKPPTTDLVANVAASARATEQVLAHLEESLRRGGFEEGLAAYQRLAETIINQRFWSHREAPSEALDRLYAVVAGRARRLFGILDSYAEIMRRLAALDALGAGDAEPSRAPRPSDDPMPSDDPILKILASGEMSLTALRSQTRGERSELKARLDMLEKEGYVTSRVASGRRLYRAGRHDKAANGDITPDLGR